MTDKELILPLFPLLAKHSLTCNVYNLGRAVGESLRKFYASNGLYETWTLQSFPSSPGTTVITVVKEALVQYQTWWLNLVQKDPIHVLIETFLIGFLAYLIFYQKKKDHRKKMKDRLSEEEIRDLLEDWKKNGRLPLNYDNHNHYDHGYNQGTTRGDDNVLQSSCGNESSSVVVKSPLDWIVIEEMKGSKVVLSIPNMESHNNKEDTEDKTPTSSSTSPLIKGSFLMKARQSSSSTTTLNKKQTFMDSSSKNDHHSKMKMKTIHAINFATHDYLGMACPNPEFFKKDVVKEASIQALSKYGCGSCGPRGFYGTIDAHLDLEDAMAKFFHTDGAILYSDGASCAASTVAAFAKRGDLLVVDEGIYEALGTGVTLSRANVKYFKHNDMQDLRRVLERVQATDESLGRKLNDQRRFIVVEALYKNYGTLCPLDELVKLKEEFCYRLILDESFSFGTMGATGRGALEHFGLEPMRHAEIITVSLENSMGSIGGITVGNEEVVDHQRLSGAGYCFSASLPPFLASAAQASLKRMETEPKVLTTLKENIGYFYNLLQSELGDIIPNKLVITSEIGLSPLVFLQLANDDDDHDDDSKRFWTRTEQVRILDEIAQKCLEMDIFIVSTGRHVTHHLHKVPPPSLRMTIMAKQSKAEIRTAISVLKTVIGKVLDDFDTEN
jgi:7-keto-8-aminopelargonate synthetase and related enzymes